MTTAAEAVITPFAGDTCGTGLGNRFWPRTRSPLAFAFSLSSANTRISLHPSGFEGDSSGCPWAPDPQGSQPTGVALQGMGGSSFPLGTSVLHTVPPGSAPRAALGCTGGDAVGTVGGKRLQWLWPGGGGGCSSRPHATCGAAEEEEEPVGAWGASGVPRNGAELQHGGNPAGRGALPKPTRVPGISTGSRSGVGWRDLQR